MTGFLITPSGIANTQIHLDKTIANTFIEVQTRSGEIGLVAIEKGMDGKSALEIANAASSRRAHSLAVRRMSKSIKGTYGLPPSMACCRCLLFYGQLFATQQQRFTDTPY